MIAAVRWMVLLAAVHQRPGWQILLVVAAGLAAERLRAYLRPGGHQRV